MSEPAKTKHDGPLNINVGEVIRERLGTRANRIPAWLVRAIERLICQDRLNEMLRVAYPRRGAEFCDAVLNHLGIRLDISGMENLPEDGRVVIASNHPLGGLDGMALISLFTRIYGPGVKFVVNDLLNAVEPLSDVFLPVNKHGSQSRRSIEAIDLAMRGDAPVIVFPAGLCSRRRNGRVEDLRWNKMFVTKAREYRRDIVPVYFIGQNSTRFYRAASIRERLGIRLNVEMALLPGEIFKAEGATFTIVCGHPVPWQSLAADAQAQAAELRGLVYRLQKKQTVK